MSVTQFQMWNLREIEKSLGFWFRVCRTDTASNFCETKNDSRETKIFLRGCNVSVMLRDDRQAKTTTVRQRRSSDIRQANTEFKRGKYLRRSRFRRIVRVERAILQRVRQSGISDDRVARIEFDRADGAHLDPDRDHQLRHRRPRQDGE